MFPFDNSAVDGYAYATASIDQGSGLAGDPAGTAGVMPSPLMPGQVARIFTGARVPEGQTVLPCRKTVWQRVSKVYVCR